MSRLYSYFTCCVPDYHHSGCIDLSANVPTAEGEHIIIKMVYTLRLVAKTKRNPSEVIVTWMLLGHLISFQCIFKGHKIYSTLKLSYLLKYMYIH